MKVIFSAALIFLLNYQYDLRAETFAKKLKKTSVIGIKSNKNYLLKTSQFIVLKNEKSAKMLNMQKFTNCTVNVTASKKSKKCSPVAAVMEGNFYLCPNQIKLFKTEDKAIKSGYTSYAGCTIATPGPSPTATPLVTPKPLNMTLSQDSGTRFSGAQSISVAKLPNGTFLTYFSNSSSTVLDPDTIRIATSADGLIFSDFNSQLAISGISPEALETFAYTTFFPLTNDEIILFYVKSKHVSSAGLDTHSLLRAVSADKINYTKTPEFSPLSGGSSLATSFTPGIFYDNSGLLRLYYKAPLQIELASSSDLGITFSEPQVVSINGRSSDYAPFPSNPSVLRKPDGNYLLFFISPLKEDSGNTSIFAAESQDGINFHIFDQPVLSGSDVFGFADADPVLLDDGSIRLYYIQRTGIGTSAVYETKSVKIQSS